MPRINAAHAGLRPRSAVHGVAGTALPLIRGRHLLAADDWARWQQCIAIGSPLGLLRRGLHDGLSVG